MSEILNIVYVLKAKAEEKDYANGLYPIKQTNGTYASPSVALITEEYVVELLSKISVQLELGI